MGKLFSYLLVMLCITKAATAQHDFMQDDEVDDPYEHASYLMYGLNYLSNNVYLGRKDSLVIPYYNPYIGYHFDNGLYAKGMLSFTPAKNRHLDLTTIEAGYEHSFGEHINGGINVDKLFYNKNSTNIKANTSGYAGIYAQYSNDIIEPQIAFDASFNKKSTDFVMNITLDHNFKFINNKLNIIPIVAMNMGTQHYYDEYFLARFVKNDKAVKLKKAVAGASQFKALDYELSIKSTYMAGKWLFTLIPTYSIPLNPAVITLPKKTLTETLTNSFYVELDICHR